MAASMHSSGRKAIENVSRADWVRRLIKNALCEGRFDICTRES
jgi:hypothetical protein